MENNNHENKGKKWSSNDLKYLLQSFKNKIPNNDIANHLKRTPLAAELKIQRYIFSNYKEINKLINETGLSNEEINKIINDVNERKEIQQYIKDKNIADNKKYEDVRKLYLYDKNIMKMKKMVEYYGLKKQLLQLRDEGFIPEEEINSLNLI